MKYKICPRCKSRNFFMITAITDEKEEISKFFCSSCLYSGNPKELKNKEIWSFIKKIKKIFKGKK